MGIVLLNRRLYIYFRKKSNQNCTTLNTTANCLFFKSEYFHYFYTMSVILIKADKQSSKILAELAKKLGGDVIDMKEEQFEDFMLGKLMDKVKTGKIVAKDLIFKKLRS